MAAPTIHVAARLPVETVERLHSLAAVSDRTFSSELRRALRVGIERAEAEARAATMTDAQLEATLRAAGIETADA